MELIETPTFTRQISALLEEEEYRLLQLRLAEDPAAGSLIRGGGGIRKIRAGAANRGRRAGIRVIYYWAARRDLILLLFAYAKADTADLTPRQAAQLGKVAKEELQHGSESV